MIAVVGDVELEEGLGSLEDVVEEECAECWRCVFSRDAVVD